MLCLFCMHTEVAGNDIPPPIDREFRGMVVATVANIDWPSSRNLSTEQQQAELIALLDLARELNFNAVLLQVRPACDALYASSIEPWSEYLTGQQGRPPDPYYDPLALAVEEAHKRGLELHAWINPFRARHTTSRSGMAPEHVSHARPAVVREYGRQLWLDPGDPQAREHTLSVIRDIVTRYDIDGLRMDDYFYPYPERDEDGNEIPFPDDQSWQAYLDSGGRLSRSDWRRENVNTFIRETYETVKSEKPWVKVGIAPFGVWRPGHPQIATGGFDAYEGLYCDSRKWLAEGWLDYISPQLYWRIGDSRRDFKTLLAWWAEQNRMERHLWPNLFSSRVDEQWPADEIIAQIEATRAEEGADGNGHFSARPFMQNRGGLADRIAAKVYAQPALIPASPWLASEKPAPPEAEILDQGKDLLVRLQPGCAAPVRLWAVQVRAGGQWSTRFYPGSLREIRIRHDSGKTPDRIAISAVNRFNLVSAPSIP
jgi:uncharacterized lipoprotein YddW (UPF0748 family)